MSYSIRQNPANSTNYTHGRLGFKITGIVIHHAATTDFDGIGRTFANPSRNASAHYGVGRNNNVDQYVDESNGAWHCGNFTQNMRSVGIENVNSSGAPDWLIDEATFNTLVELVYDIAMRNSLLPLRTGANGNLTGHKDWKATACPGQLYARLDELAQRVNAMAKGDVPTPVVPVPDQILKVGEKFVFNHTYRVDELKRIGGIWQVRTNKLCPVDFTWNDNGIPVMPLTEVPGGVGNGSDQRLQTGSLYKIPGTYTVLDLGQHKGRWMAKIKMQGWTLWVDIESVTEV